MPFPSLPFVRGSHFLAEWLLLGGSLLIVGLVLAYSVIDEHGALARSEEERLVTQARVIHDNLGRQLAAVNGALVNVRDELPRWQELGDGMTQANRLLNAFTEAMPGVRTMTILDAGGVVLAANRPELVGTDFHERAYFRMAAEAPSREMLYLSPPFKTSLGVWSMNAVRAILGVGGEFSGIVSATLDPEEFRILLESVRYAADMRVSLAHGEGIALQSAPDIQGLPGKNLAVPDSMFLRHRASGQTATVMTGPVRATGDLRIIAQHDFRPAALNMSHHLNVAVSRDLDAVFAPWRRNALVKGGLFALLVGSSVPGLFLFQRRRRLADQEASLAAAALRRKTEELEQLNRQLQEQSAQLRDLAFVDGLTGAANRRRFDEGLQAEWRRCRRDRSPLALLMIDIDHFKRYNDCYGHQAGDTCLQAVAGVLRARFGRAHDLVARYGGEEFVCLMPDSALATTRRKGEEICRAVAALAIPHETSPTAGVVTISVGVASSVPGPDAEPEQLLTAADLALYLAKSGGRNQVRSPEDEREKTAPTYSLLSQ